MTINVSDMEYLLTDQDFGSIFQYIYIDTIPNYLNIKNTLKKFAAEILRNVKNVQPQPKCRQSYF